MNAIIKVCSRITTALSSPFAESLALLFARIALGGIFWRSYKTKVEEGTLFRSARCNISSSKMSFPAFRCHPASPYRLPPMPNLCFRLRSPLDWPRAFAQAG